MQLFVVGLDILVGGLMTAICKQMITFKNVIKELKLINTQDFRDTLKSTYFF